MNLVGGLACCSTGSSTNIFFTYRGAAMVPLVFWSSRASGCSNAGASQKAVMVSMTRNRWMKDPKALEEAERFYNFVGNMSFASSG